MSIFIIILLIFGGIALLFLEFFVVPGVSIPGIVGFALIVTAIYFSYSTYGIFYGNLILASTTVILFILVLIGIRKKTWHKVSLETEIKSKVNEIKTEDIKVGDKGLTISRLAPMGKISVNGIYVEAEALNQFVDQNTEIEIVKVLQNKVIVKTIIK